MDLHRRSTGLMESLFQVAEQGQVSSHGTNTKASPCIASKGMKEEDKTLHVGR